MSASLARSIAQQCSVIRVPNFFSSEDIDKIFEVQQIYREAFSEPPPKRPFWVTTYLSTNDLLKSNEPKLYQRLSDLRFKVDPQLVGFDLASLNIRCTELHSYGPGGGLQDLRHFDDGSVITLDVMLDDDFTGGQFQTPENIGTDSYHLKDHKFQRGDALIFPSEKYHCVSPILTGCRKVLVMEFWKGLERHCDHRCLQFHGKCLHVRTKIPVSPPIFDHHFF